jgi:hypothetical protein
LSLQRRSTGQTGPTGVPPIVHEALRSPGRPLDPATRAFVEPRFGHDFGKVRVHADAQADESARAVSAVAFTVGHDIVFGAGQYSPGTAAGQRLLAHELAHVVQQGGAPRLLQRQGQATDSKVADEQLDEVLALVQTFIQTLQQKNLESAGETETSPQYEAPVTDLETALEQLTALRTSGTAEQKLAIAQQFKSLLAQRGGLRGQAAPVVAQRKPAGSEISDDPLEREADAAAEQVVDARSGTLGLPPLSRGSLGSRGTIQKQGGPAEAVVIGGGIAAGPPGWVILAVGAAAIAIGIGIAYVATRPRAVPLPVTCATAYPTVNYCATLAGYDYLSPQAALQALKQRTGINNLRLVSARPTTSGPCPGEGTHYGVKSDGEYIASIVCCPCCLEIGGVPTLITRCRIV